MKVSMMDINKTIAKSPKKMKNKFLMLDKLTFGEAFLDTALT